MTRNELKSITPGTIIYNDGRHGSVVKLSKDGENVLVRFNNGDICWFPYYMLEL